MSEEYDQITAFHYSAFRPQLHQVILDKCFNANEKKSLGLDIGCGTGQSSIALANYCEKVIGIEPSSEMFEKAIKHPSIEYVLNDCERFPFENDCFDTITFAGSLFYAKSQKLLDEVIRVAKSNAKIIVYDFVVNLDIFLTKLNIDSSVKNQPQYNHQVNFSGLNQQNIEATKELKESLSIEIANSNLAHLLLSSKDDYGLLLNKFGNDHLFENVSRNLNEILETERSNIDAATYLKVYGIKKY